MGAADVRRARPFARLPADVEASLVASSRDAELSTYFIAFDISGGGVVRHGEGPRLHETAES